MNSLLLALQITALGMGLVFAALILLWGLMNLLTALTADNEQPSRQKITGSSPAGPATDGNAKARAAAIAVAIAMAERRASSVHPLHEPPTTIVSAWQLGMRTRQMYQKGVSIKRRTG